MVVEDRKLSKGSGAAYKAHIFRRTVIEQKTIMRKR